MANQMIEKIETDGAKAVWRMYQATNGVISGLPVLSADEDRITRTLTTKYCNGTTGTTITDGLDVGITAGGTAEIRQRENLPLNIYTNNQSRITIDANGNTTLSSLEGTGNRTVVVDSTGKLASHCTDIKISSTLTADIPFSTGISVNGGLAGMTYMLYYSSQWDAGNNTFSGVYMLRCGYSGNNFEVKTISESAGIYIFKPLFTQVEGILHITSPQGCRMSLRAVANK